MNVGDPKKAAVLGAVALVIVGVAVMKSIPKADPKPARTAPASTTSAEATGTAVEKAVEAAERLKADPFAHPSLESEEDKKRKSGGATDSAPAGRDIKGQIPADWRPPYRVTEEQIRSLTGDIRGDQVPGTTNASQGDSPGGAANTSGNTGSNQESEEKQQKRQVLVEGTISVDKARAFIAVDAEEAAAYKVGDKVRFKVGDKVGTLGKITRITDNEVVIDRDGKKHVLPVGKKVDF